MLTEKDYCDYETCVALCELGMMVASRNVYKEKDAPLKSSSRGIIYTVRTASAHGYVIGIPLYEAQKWLREEKKIIVNIDIDYNWYYGIYFSEGNIYSPQFSEGEYGSYEEALSEGIKEAAKILKEER